MNKNIKKFVMIPLLGKDGRPTDSVLRLNSEGVLFKHLMNLTSFDKGISGGDKTITITVKKNKDGLIEII